MKNKIKYFKIHVNQANLEDIIAIHKICDKDFEPVLSNRVNIIEYSKKLLQYAEIITINDENNIIGIACIYCNNFKSEVAFLSSICILKNYRGIGLSKLLLIKCIEIAQKKNMKKLKLEVGKNNNKAIRLYKKNGFRIIEYFEYSYLMILEL